MEAVRKQRPEPNRRVGRAPAAPLTPGQRRKRLALRILGWSVVGGLVAVALTAVGLALVFWHYSHGLPSIKNLRDYHPKQVTVIQDRNGDRIGEIYTERRTFVGYDEVPKMMVDAFVVAEDANFWNHGGIDYRGMIRAAFTNLRSGRTRHGASTITQQVVKNFVLSPERTFKRKIQEIILARRLESALSKKEILTLYMNQIYFGGGRYGVQEAARFYFGKDVKELDVGEMALLAGLPQAPEEISPHKNPQRAKDRQIYVLNQLVRHGKITEAEARRWIDAPIQVVRKPYPMLDSAPEWLEVVRADLIDEYGADLDTLGTVVKTTLRPEVQATAQRALQGALRAYDGRHKLGRPVRQIKADKIDLELARLKKKLPGGGPKAGEVYEALVIEVHDADNELVVDLGGWQASMILGGADDDRWNPAVDGKRKKPAERFAKGDVIKVTKAPAPAKGQPAPKLAHGNKENRVVLAPGPEGAIVVMDVKTRDVWAMVGGFASRAAGFDRATMARRQPGSSFKPIVFAAALATGRFTPATVVNDSPEVYDLWKPKNYKTGAFEGPVRLRYALAKSINTVAIKVLHDVGPENAVALAKQLGITGELPTTLSLALGSGEVTPLELTNAFATFADGGVYAPPRFVQSVGGKPKGAVQGTQVVAPEVAYVITDMMRSVVEQGTAAKAKSLGLTIAGKTGTSNDARDTWFIGMTPDVVIGVWVGNDDSTPMGNGEAGGVTALPAFIDVAKSLKLDNKAFPRPANVESRAIDLATGLLAAEGAPAGSQANEVFVKGTAPTEVAARPGEIDATTFVTDEYGDEAPQPASQPE